MESIPILETSETIGTPIAETRAQVELDGDDPVSQAMLKVLERVVRNRTGITPRDSVTEQLHSNGAELFRGVIRAPPIVGEYWLEETKRIMDDLE